MKKYVLNTAALTIASLMAASASMASTQAFWDDASTIQGSTIVAGGNVGLLPGGGAVDSESVKQILGTGSVAGTANLVDASAVSNRLLTAPLTTDYDAFDFTAGALGANQTFTGRANALGLLMNAGFVAGQNLETNGVTVLATATNAGVGTIPADILGAINTAATLLGGAGATLNTAATDVSDLVGGVQTVPGTFDVASVSDRLDDERDVLSVDATAPIASIHAARVQVSTAVGFTATRPVGDSVMTRLTGLDPANNTNARLAGSLSGLLSIVPADNILAQAEARRADLQAALAALAAGPWTGVLPASGLAFAAPATNAAAWLATTGAPSPSLEALIALLA